MPTAAADKTVSPPAQAELPDKRAGSDAKLAPSRPGMGETRPFIAFSRQITTAYLRTIIRIIIINKNHGHY